VVNEIPDELLRQSIPDPERLEALRGLGMRAVMSVPMAAASGVLGVISFVSAESSRTFSPADVALAEELGRRAGAAVENARLYTERSQIANTLQASLLPDELPDIPGFRLASLYRPAGEQNFVGGDFYEAFEAGSGWMLVIGDVTGRGAQAASLTAQARHTLRTAAILLADPTAAIDHLNGALVGKSEVSVCTVAAVHLVDGDESTSATIVCAGHPQPYLVRAGQVQQIGGTGPVVGAWQSSRWNAQTVELLPGDVLVLYTDGVLDARGADARFGEERLAAALREAAGAQDAVARVLAALQGFERGAQADDTAVVALERLATPAGLQTADGGGVTTPASR
jgi:serine phosphatase RsbU (regulator of sigma subunit)